MYSSRIFLFLTTLLLSTGLSAQLFTGVGTKWSDDFIEWNLYTDLDEEAETGEILMRWQMQRDWTEWDFNVDETRGTIRQKWKGDPSQWEINGPNEIITARMLWKGDIREWRVTNNSITLTLKSRWGNNLNEWQLKGDRYGTFHLVTRWENDPREWEIFDDLDEKISPTMKIALVFLATYHSSPKD